MTTDPQPLTSTTPADLTFRTLARMAKERALSDAPEEGQIDMRPAWRFCGILCGQGNRLTRQIPEQVRALFTARHIATLFSLAARPTPVDSSERTSWRMGYSLLLATLQREGVQPAESIGEAVLGCALWACLQRVALQEAMSDLRPKIVAPGRDPAAEAQALRQQLLHLRENLIADWAEATMTLGGALVQLADTRAAEAEHRRAQETVAQEVPADG